MLGELVFLRDRISRCQKEHSITHMWNRPRFEHAAVKACGPVGGIPHPRLVFSRMTVICCWNCPVGLLLLSLVKTSPKCSGCQLGLTRGFCPTACDYYGKRVKSIVESILSLLLGSMVPNFRTSCLFQMRSYFVVLAVLELAVLTRLASLRNIPLSVQITDMHY